MNGNLIYLLCGVEGVLEPGREKGGLSQPGACTD